MEVLRCLPKTTIFVTIRFTKCQTLSEKGSTLHKVRNVLPLGNPYLILQFALSFSGPVNPLGQIIRYVCLGLPDFPDAT